MLDSNAFTVYLFTAFLLAILGFLLVTMFLGITFLANHFPIAISLNEGAHYETVLSQISREIFVNDAIYQQEQEQVFARAWLFLGHDSQIPRPGDYFVTCMGEESVILCRDRFG